MENSSQLKYLNIPTNKIESILKRMDSISLKEMQQISLMDRIDTKYVAPLSLLPQILEEMIPHFRVQENNGNRIAPYCTQYLDTPNLHLFIMHQNGKLNRQKIRIRSYLDSHLSFLEIKNKNNKGRTSKVRTRVNLSHIKSVDDLITQKDFLEKHAIVDCQFLKPMLGNDFKRITLVNNNATERVTLDFDLSFTNYETKRQERMPNLLILELKQDGWSHSDFRDILNRLRIRNVSISKYCIGTTLTNPYAKYNRFKNKMIRINKLIK